MTLNLIGPVNYNATSTSTLNPIGLKKKILLDFQDSISSKVGLFDNVSV